jgi:hypothetical protein
MPYRGIPERLCKPFRAEISVREKVEKGRSPASPPAKMASHLSMYSSTVKGSGESKCKHGEIF